MLILHGIIKNSLSVSSTAPDFVEATGRSIIQASLCGATVCRTRYAASGDDSGMGMTFGVNFYILENNGFATL